MSWTSMRPRRLESCGKVRLKLMGSCGRCKAMSLFLRRQANTGSVPGRRKPL